METTNIRRKLHQFIDAMEDKKAEAMYIMFENEVDAGLQRKKLIEAERTQHLNGKGKVYSWNEVKQMALDKLKRHAI